jgi:hypothetical protein
VISTSLPIGTKPHGATAVTAGGELDRHLGAAEQALADRDEAALVAQYPDVATMVPRSLHARVVLEVVADCER